MDCENVFNAARDDKISELKDILEHKSGDEVRELVSALTNGATPLTIACANGHSDVVTYLLEQCQADVEQTGTVDHDKEKPLYFAVYYGHLKIVKLLIKHKASVNGTGEFKSPLFSVCCDDHLEIVKCLVDHGAAIDSAGDEVSTCLQSACLGGHYEVAKYLLECGADANRKNTAGHTALHVSVISGNLKIIELLLENGAKSTTYRNGLTPLLSAANMGHVSIVEYFFEKWKCTKQERVDALELLGAAFVDGDNDINRARDFWRMAMNLRYEDEAFRLEKPLDKSPISSYVATTEVSTVEQLDELMEDEMQINALLVRERILGPGSLNSILNIQRRGRTYAENGNFQGCTQLWMYIFDTEMDRRIDKELDDIEEEIRNDVVLTLAEFTELYYMIISDVGPVQMNDPPVLFRDIIRVFENALKPIETALSGSQKQECDFINSYYYGDVLTVAMNLLSLMCRLRLYLKPDEENSLKKAAYKLVQLNPKGRNGFTPLHIASCNYSSTVGYDDSEEEYFVLPPELALPNFTSPSLDVVRLLLEVGACPNARDSSNNTSLHVAAMNRPSATDVFQTLLKQGAHIDLYNNENKTPLQLVDDASLLDIYPLQHINLQCLCAQEINNRTITYKGSVPKILCKFIELHSSH